MHQDPYRPQFHFTPDRNWINDPNGLVYHDGEYHLFYQYNPYGDTWGHMSWGHAVSTDLIHWEPLPVALPEVGGVMMYSGCAVVDWSNTSGFGSDGNPPLVALYTGHHTGRPRQDQRLAYSTDRGRTWIQYAGNPVLDIGETEFRDPKVFWHDPTHRWIMVVALPLRRKVSFYHSPDLKHWIPLSNFGPAGSITGVWECPDLFRLPVEGAGGTDRWVLLVNVNAGAPATGSGCQYFVGHFDGTTFALDPLYPALCDADGMNALWMDYGPDFYAAVSWSDIPPRDGRRLILGWMSNWEYAAKLPTSPWRGAMSIPRVLTLRPSAEGPRLSQHPVGELARQYQDQAWTFAPGPFQAAADWLSSLPPLTPLLDAEFMFTGLTPSAPFTLTVQAGAGEETVITIDTRQGKLRLDRSRSGSVTIAPQWQSVHEAPLRLTPGGLSLRLLLDRSSLEVFACGGTTVLTELMFPASEARHVRLTAGTDGSPRSVGITLRMLDVKRTPQPS